MSKLFELINEYGGNAEMIRDLRKSGNYIYFTGIFSGNDYTVIEVDGKIQVYVDGEIYDTFDTAEDLLIYFGFLHH